MIHRLWGRASSVNVQKVMWALAEAGVPHERRDAGGRYGVNDTEEFAKMNPNRRVPVWEEDGLALWESHAILRHLARTHAPELLPGTPWEQAVADQWTEFVSTTLEPPFIGVFFQTVRLPLEKRSAAGLERHLSALDAALDILDARLREVDWLGGGAFSIADIAAGALMYRIHDVDIPRPERPALTAWHARLQERPAYRDVVMTSYEELRGG